MYFRQSRQTEALAEFTAAVMLNPTRADSHAAIGQVHLRSGNYAEAVAAARRAVALDDSHKEARYVLATSLVRMGSVDEGKRELEGINACKPKPPLHRSRQLEIEGLRRDASVSIVNGEFAKAVALLRQALERDAESAQSHLDLGLALLKAGQPAEAVGHLTAAAAATTARTRTRIWPRPTGHSGGAPRPIVSARSSPECGRTRCVARGPDVEDRCAIAAAISRLVIRVGISQTPANVQFVNASAKAGSRSSTSTAPARTATSTKS